MNDMNVDIFNLNDEQPQPIKGSLLVARPTISDPFFGRSVIALMHHDPQGSMGLILNKVTNLMLDEIIDNVPAGSEIPVFMGGPVELDRVFYLHNLDAEWIPGGEPMSCGLYLGGDFDALKRYLASGEPINEHIRFFVGYSGWDAGQLTGEIDRHDWVVLDGIDSSWIMTHPRDDMWNDAVSRFGDRYRLWHNWPEFPSEN